MNDKLHIAFIDDGICKKYFSNITFYKDLRISNGVLTEINSFESVDYSHGTTCLSIFLLNLSPSYHHNIMITSIKILEENTLGQTEDLMLALKWSDENKVKIINLSIGTIHFSDYKILRNCVNTLAFHKTVLIAAHDNSGYITYPASFSNAVGVKAIKDGDYYKTIQHNEDFKYDHIEICAKAQHELFLYGQFITTSRLNSFATPFVSAVAVEQLLSGWINNVVELKNKLCLNHNLDITYPIFFDWSITSYIICDDSIKIMEEELNFSVIKKNIIDEHTSASTLIQDINLKKEWFDTLVIIYRHASKELILFFNLLSQLECENLVVVDLDNIIQLNHYVLQKQFLRLCLCPDIQINDINTNKTGLSRFGIEKYTAESCEIPIIAVCMEDLEKLMDFLLYTRNEFYINNYNCIAITNSPLGLIYEMLVFDEIDEIQLYKISTVRCADIIIAGIYMNNWNPGKVLFDYDLIFCDENSKNNIRNQDTILLDLKKVSLYESILSNFN